MNKFYTDEKDIISWLDKYEVKNYTLISDDKYRFVVNINGDVNVWGRELEFIPVKFGEVLGNFFCSHNKLNSLEFSPISVSGGFFCKKNELISLEFCPSYIGGTFDCSYNKLISLEFCPISVSNGIFYCDNNLELEEAQNIKAFKEIYSIHKKLVVEKFAGNLDTSLNYVEEIKKTKFKL